MQIKNVPHIHEYLGTIKQDTWLILGKGPSFDLNKIKNVDRSKVAICTVNDTARLVQDSDLNYSNHKHVIALSKSNENHGAYCTPQLLDWNRTVEYTLDNIMFCAETLLRLKDKLYSCDITLSQGRIRYEDRRPINAHPPSGFAALCILKSFGFKNFILNGFDGGKKHHEMFELFDSNNENQQVDHDHNGYLGRMAAYIQKHKLNVNTL